MSPYPPIGSRVLVKVLAICTLIAWLIGSLWALVTWIVGKGNA